MGRNKPSQYRYIVYADVVVLNSKRRFEHVVVESDTIEKDVLLSAIQSSVEGSVLKAEASVFINDGLEERFSTYLEFVPTP